MQHKALIYGETRRFKSGITFTGSPYPFSSPNKFVFKLASSLSIKAYETSQPEGYFQKINNIPSAHASSIQYCKLRTPGGLLGSSNKGKYSG